MTTPHAARLGTRFRNDSRMICRHRPIRSGARDGELDRASGDMSKFDPDDYEEKLKHLEQRHEILAAWIVMVFVALLFIGLESFLAGAHHVVWHRHAFAPGIAFVDPSAGSIAA